MIANIAVCDDSFVLAHLITDKVSAELERYKPKGLSYSISTYVSGLELIEQHAISPFDIIFLDIEMPGVTGFEAIAPLQQIKQDTIIVFLTSHDQLVYEALSYSPFTFVKKEDFVVELPYLIRTLYQELTSHKSRAQEYVVSYRHTSTAILVDEIIYVTTYKRGSIIHTLRGGDVNTPLHAKQVVKDIGSPDFIQCHRSFFVNLQHVQLIRDDKVRLSNNIILPVGRAYLSKLKHNFLRFRRV